MNLQEIKNNKSEKGFTIVELLIVIVVIGILAAIVIVSFSGIQQRARDTQYNTDASAIIKKAEGRNADAGGYPTAAGQFTGDIAALPSGIAVSFNTVAPTTAYASAASTTAAVVEVSGTKTYRVTSCGSGTGLRVYYAEGTAVKSLVAGTGC